MSCLLRPDSISHWVENSLDPRAKSRVSGLLIHGQKIYEYEVCRKSHDTHGTVNVSGILFNVINIVALYF